LGSTIYTRIPVPDPALVAESGRYTVADLHESLGPVQGRQSLMSPRMRPLLQSRRISGAAITSYNYPGDNLMIHAALKIAEKGQVLVLTNGGGSQGALWGDLASTFAAKKGIAGVVVDGPIRDVDALREIGVPIWTTAISPAHPEKRGPGSVNVPTVVDGVLVEPGDVIAADGDGVLVIPRAHLAHAVAGARERALKEATIRQRIEAGDALFDILHIEAALRQAGIEEVNATWKQE
jgi:4-hydroxy-4-methyl-2-oxoglutarate aldolase